MASGGRRARGRTTDLAKVPPAGDAGHDNLEQSIFDISVTPWNNAYRLSEDRPAGDIKSDAPRGWVYLTVLALDLGDARDVSGTEGGHAGRKGEEEKNPHDDGGRFGKRHGWGVSSGRGGSKIACWLVALLSVS